MKMRRNVQQYAGAGFVLFGVAGLICLQANDLAAQTVREVAVPGMRGIASVGYRGNQLTVEYNPRVCARMGPDLCSFFRAHEYGHIALRHLERGTPVRQAEYEADVWAARNSSPASRAAAIRFFNSGNGGSFVHGSGRARANRIVGVGTRPSSRVLIRQDGSRVFNRGYSAIAAGPFNTGGLRPFLRRWRR